MKTESEIIAEKQKRTDLVNNPPIGDMIVDRTSFTAQVTELEWVLGPPLKTEIEVTDRLNLIPDDLVNPIQIDISKRYILQWVLE